MLSRALVEQRDLDDPGAPGRDPFGQAALI
jgi:hypothetical protein